VHKEPVNKSPDCLPILEEIMRNIEELKQLGKIVKKKNYVDAEIARIINRPAHRGHAGEYIASLVIDIDQEHSSSNKSTDGKFRAGNLLGKTVNIKWYGKQQGILDVNSISDFHLVMTGPKMAAVSSRGTISPWVIDKIFLFETARLINELQARGINKRGIATSVAEELWQRAEVYPQQRSNQLVFTEEQKQLLSLFN
jgi:hypothetical protein